MERRAGWSGGERRRADGSSGGAGGASSGASGSLERPRRSSGSQSSGSKLRPKREWTKEEEDGERVMVRLAKRLGLRHAGPTCGPQRLETCLFASNRGVRLIRWFLQSKHKLVSM
ncbi:hypothetical protein BRADI_5g05152v3 [Brachypodium distachyon]|uniref:Uncharacterized protein n=1 Tax=Brachypodium distachyon TaxID=15368 RepID=A0A2K2CFJ8_BRADI|nr:hypothetical protein BRADI_5g05152v3 [Brachypodium distachyon]